MNSASASKDRRLPPGVQWAAILFALGFPTAFTYVYFFAAAGEHSHGQQVAYGVGKAIQFLFPVVWVAAVQRRRMRFQAPTTNGVALGVVTGSAVALIMITAYFCWLAPAGDLVDVAPKVKDKLLEFQIDTPKKLVAMGLFYALLHSLLEEYYWRWFVFGELRRLVPLPAAIAVSSIAFMGHHVIVLWHYLDWPLAILASAAVAFGGAMWAWLYQRSGSIYAPWLSHLLIDAAIFTIAFEMVMHVH
jgi:membrane protease YdiL (CAAX protease family)